MSATKQMSQDFWKNHITIGNRHPKGVRDYCRENHINHAQFYYWRSKLLVENKLPISKLTKSRFVPATIEPTLVKVRELPDARWLASFAVELIRGLHA